MPWQVDVGEMLAVHALSAENMPAIYDAARGKPVLHDTALQLHVNYTNTDDHDHMVSYLRISYSNRALANGKLQKTETRDSLFPSRLSSLSGNLLTTVF